MTNSPVIIMKDRLQLLQGERRLNIGANKEFKKDKGRYSGSIGLKIQNLMKNYEKTLGDIKNFIDSELAIQTPDSTFYAWAQGSEPRGIAHEVEKALDKLITTSTKVDGGTWISGDELVARMTKINQEHSISEMHKITGVAVATLYSWQSGARKTNRKKFEEFERSFHKPG